MDLHHFYRKLARFFIFLSLPQCLFAEIPDNEIKKQEIHIFIHVCTINHWESVLLRQLDRIHSSGLYDACSSIRLGVLGSGDISRIIDRYPKLTILFQDSRTSLYERPVLLNLHEFCSSSSNAEALILYLHTKGVSRPSPGFFECIQDWSNLMEYFCIDLWPNCVAALQDHDICGVNLQSTPSLHFSGNFWWACARYIATLPDYIGPDYGAPETWIGLNSPKAKNFHKSGVNHYDTLYPESKYKLNLAEKN